MIKILDVKISSFYRHASCEVSCQIHYFNITSRRMCSYEISKGRELRCHSSVTEAPGYWLDDRGLIKGETGSSFATMSELALSPRYLQLHGYQRVVSQG
jgi:hypothetical protein